MELPSAFNFIFSSLILSLSNFSSNESVLSCSLADFICVCSDFICICCDLPCARTWEAVRRPGFACSTSLVEDLLVDDSSGELCADRVAHPTYDCSSSFSSSGPMQFWTESIVDSTVLWEDSWNKERPIDLASSTSLAEYRMKYGKSSNPFIVWSGRVAVSKN